MKNKLITIAMAICLSIGIISLLSYNAVSIEVPNQYVSISISKAEAQELFTEGRTDKDNYYEYVLKGGDRVLAGNKDVAEFEPHLYLEKWAGESYIQVSLPDVASFLSADVIDDNKVSWSDSTTEVQMYALQPHEAYNSEDGAFEFEMILKEKPASSVTVLDLSFSKDLEFYEILELTPEQIEAGYSIEEHLVGGWVVQHKTKRNDEYKTGKLGHFFSPKLIDSKGWEVEGELVINPENGWLAVYMPVEFYDKAVYPVYHAIGLTFGYTGAGVSPIIPISDKIVGSKFTLTEAGSISKITAYLSCDDDSFLAKTAIYDTDNNLMGASSETTVSGSVAWYDFTLSPNVDINAGDYYLVAWSDYDEYYLTSIYGSALGANNIYGDLETYGTFPNPASLVWEESIPYTGSIYATYSQITESSPTVTNSTGESDVTDTTARLNGELTAGGKATTHIYWGDNDGGTNSELWDYDENLGEKVEGTFCKDISGLTPETPYYYRCYVTNGVGNDWADSTEPFTTIATPAYPIFTGTVTIDPSSANRNSASFSHTTPTDDDRLIIVAIGYKYGFSTYSVSGVTYNSVALTQAVKKIGGTMFNYWVSEFWYLKEPATGSNTVAVTWTGNVNPSNVAVLSYKNVNQTTPVDATGSNSGLSNSPFTNITTNNNTSLVVGGLFIEGGDTDPFTEGANITERYDGATGISGSQDGGYWGGEKEKATAGLTTLDCTASASDDWAICAIEVCGAEGEATPDISNVGGSHDYGVVAMSSTYTSGLTKWTVTNNSGASVDIDIHGHDATGGNGWTLSDTATPDGDTFGLKAGLEGGDYTIIVKKNTPYNDLVTGLADEATQKWGLKLYSPTSHSDGVQKSAIITITASLS